MELRLRQQDASGIAVHLEQQTVAGLRQLLNAILPIQDASEPSKLAGYYWSDDRLIERLKRVKQKLARGPEDLTHSRRHESAIPNAGAGGIEEVVEQKEETAAPNGPFLPDGFRWNGTEKTGIVGKSHELLVLISRAGADGAMVTEITEELWGQEEGRKNYDQLRNATNKKLKPLKCKIETKNGRAVVIDQPDPIGGTHRSKRARKRQRQN